MSTTPPPVADRTPWGRVVGVAIALAALVGVILLAFSWPAVTADPHDLPVGVVGPSVAVAPVEKAVASASDGAIALTRYDDRDAARTAIEAREAYGAIVLGTAPTDAPEVLTATAANPQVAQLLGQLAQQLQTRIAEQVPAGVAPPTVKVTDVVPFADTDPRGAGLTAAMFPLVIGGMLGGIALSIAVVGGVRRLVGVLVHSVIAGAVIVAILQGWYGALLGSFWLDAAAMSLAVAAVAATVTGLAGLLGRPGIALGAVLVLLVGNPLSAAAVPLEFIVSPWGAIGQWMPPGAAATLIRDLSYFPAADTTFPWLVLAGWAIVGLVLTLLARRRSPAPVTQPA